MGTCSVSKLTRPAVPDPLPSTPLGLAVYRFHPFFTPIKGNLGALTYYCCSVNDWHKYYLLITQNFEFFSPKTFAGLFHCPVFPNSLFPFI